MADTVDDDVTTSLDRLRPLTTVCTGCGEMCEPDLDGLCDDCRVATLPSDRLSRNEPVRQSPDIADTEVPGTQADGNARPGGRAAPTAAVLSTFGEYDLIRRIARGGMGVVYQAEHRQLRRSVALKMILAGQLASDQDLRRFYEEAGAAALLDHPNIVPIFEVGEHDGQHYFTMKLINGGSLSRCIEEYHGDNRRIVGLLHTVSEAVHHAHQRGIIHRDLKPANILLDKDAQPHITDFGIAKQIESDDLTGSDVVVGTPDYMAPEQALGVKPLTTAADVYSLGAILYELLTGKTPFADFVAAEKIMRLVSDEPAPPSQRAKGVDRDLEVICLKCLEKDPQQRYSSAQELADELDRWLRGEPILARRATALERVRKWALRRPAVALMLSLVVAAVVAAVAALLVSTVKVRRAQEEMLHALNERTAALAREQLARRDAEDERAVANELRDGAEAARLRAELDRDRARQERGRAQAALARSHYEQARALGTSETPGRRAQMLALVDQAGFIVRRLTRPDSEVQAEGLPTRDELRSTAISALMQRDAENVWKNIQSRGTAVRLSGDGSTLVTLMPTGGGGEISRASGPHRSWGGILPCRMTAVLLSLRTGLSSQMAMPASGSDSGRQPPASVPWRICRCR
jgi:hypothetical protein